MLSPERGLWLLLASAEGAGPRREGCAGRGVAGPRLAVRPALLRAAGPCSVPVSELPSSA